MVDPNLMSGLNTDGVTSRSQDLGNLDVADNDIVDVDDTKTNTVEHWRQSHFNTRRLISVKGTYQRSYQVRTCWIRL